MATQHGADETPRIARHILPVHIHRQPNDETCGPTCLHAVYRYWDDDLPLDEVIATVRSLDEDDAGRGTLAVNLGSHALERGYQATLYTFNVLVFDPTWFNDDGTADPELLTERLRARATHKAEDIRSSAAICAYLRFLDDGGEIRFEDLTGALISSLIRSGRPILTGVSATYLYRAMREFGPNDDEDDVRGEPVGHFIVIRGYESERRVVHIADPLEDNPAFASRNYTVPLSRLISSIMLGVLTYDANMLVIEPPSSASDPEAGV